MLVQLLSVDDPDVSWPLSLRLLMQASEAEEVGVLCRPTAIPMGLLSSTEEIDSGDVTVSLFNLLLRLSLVDPEVVEAGLVKRLSLGL
jgi:hypothetical protein